MRDPDCVNTVCEFHDPEADQNCGGEREGEPAIAMCLHSQSMAPPDTFASLRAALAAAEERSRQAEQRTYRYGEEAKAMEDRAEKAEAECERLANLNNFDATRLRRLANLCGMSLHDESDEFLLNVAGTILGGICSSVETLQKQLTVYHDALTEAVTKLQAARENGDYYKRHASEYRDKCITTTAAKERA